MQSNAYKLQSCLCDIKVKVYARGWLGAIICARIFIYFIIMILVILSVSVGWSFVYIFQPFFSFLFFFYLIAICIIKSVIDIIQKQNKKLHRAKDTQLLWSWRMRLLAAINHCARTSTTIDHRYESLALLKNAKKDHANKMLNVFL